MGVAGGKGKVKRPPPPPHHLIEKSPVLGFGGRVTHKPSCPPFPPRSFQNQFFKKMVLKGLICCLNVVDFSLRVIQSIVRFFAPPGGFLMSQLGILPLSLSRTPSFAQFINIFSTFYFDINILNSSHGANPKWSHQNEKCLIDPFGGGGFDGLTLFVHCTDFELIVSNSLSMKILVSGHL